jgi:hypothetical protein
LNLVAFEVRALNSGIKFAQYDIADHYSSPSGLSALR